MSFLSEVLINAEQAKIQNTEEKLEQLNAVVERSRREVTQFLDNIYVKYSNKPQLNRKLASALGDLVNEVKSMKETLDNIGQNALTKTESQLNSYQTQCIAIQHDTVALKSIMDIHTALMQADKLVQQRLFAACFKEMQLAEEKLLFLRNEYLLAAALSKAFMDLISSRKSTLKDVILCEFNKYIICGDSKDEYFVKIAQHCDNLKILLKDIYTFGYCSDAMLNLADFIFNKLLTPIVHGDISSVVSKEFDEFHVLNAVRQSHIDKQHYKELLRRIEQLMIAIAFIDQKFDISIDEENRINLVTYFSKTFSDELRALLQKQIFDENRLWQVDDFHDFNDMCVQTQQLEKILKQTNLVPDIDGVLLSVVHHWSKLYTEQIYLKCLRDVKELLKKDLHDYCSTSSDNGSTYPESSVSKHVVELLRCLAHIKMDSDQEHLIKLANNRRRQLYADVATLYSKFIPIYHQKLIDDIPQQMALFYNNCNYLAHRLIQMDDVYAAKIPTEPETDTGSFDEAIQNEIYSLRSVASARWKTFLQQQLQRQCQTIDEAPLLQPAVNSFIGSGGDSAHASRYVQGESSSLTVTNLEEATERTEKCLRQCIRQCEVLKCVWENVLPRHIYEHAMLEIVDNLCEYICTLLLRVEDIAAPVANNLADLLENVICKRAEKLLSNGAISQLSSAWARVSEVVFLLRATVIQVGDRWGSGKGMLAACFTAKEVRHFVRALFQNNERRAALLSHLHD